MLIERDNPDDDEGAWEGWFGIARNLLPGERPPHLDRNADDAAKAEANMWIDRVVEAFADARVDAADTYNAALPGRRS